MSGAIMNKVWDLFGMDNAEDKDENEYEYEYGRAEVDIRTIQGGYSPVEEHAP